MKFDTSCSIYSRTPVFRSLALKSLVSRYLARIIIALIGVIAMLGAQAGTTQSARKLIDLLDVPDRLENTILGAVDDARRDLLARGMPSSTVNLVTTAMKVEVLASIPDLLDEVTGIYADEFTEPELQDLIAFYESPTGQKYVRSQSTIASKQSDALKNWLGEVRTRTAQRITNAAGA